MNPNPICIVFGSKTVCDRCFSFLFFLFYNKSFSESHFFLHAAMHKTDAPKYNHKSLMSAVKVSVSGGDKQKYCLIIEF